MERITVKSKTWVCPQCGYPQDTDPYDEAIQHHPHYFPNVPLGKCPACFEARRGSYDMGIPLSDSLPTKMTFASDEDIALTREPVIENGVIRQVEVGRQDYYQFDAATGTLTNVGIPILEDVQRELTDQEFSQKVEDRDRSLDELDRRGMIVQEITQENPEPPSVDEIFSREPDSQEIPPEIQPTDMEF